MKYILIFLCVFILAGCGAAGVKEPEVLTIALWNVQNLFDGEETGTEYADFRQGAGWGPEKYQARLTSLSQAITTKPAAPDLIGFIEVENSGVLADLSRSLSKNGYNWTAFTKLPGSAAGIGFLSSFPLLEVKAHSITIGQETAPRPVLELRLDVRGETLVFLLNHWKSKLGGADATESIRRASARVVYRRLSEIKEAEGDTPVIIMGDFNLNHDDFYRRSLSGNLVLCALLPDDPEASLLVVNAQGSAISQPDFLVLSTQKPPLPVYFPEEIHALYSPWGEEKEGGSYFYREEWETIDGFLLSKGAFSGAGWEFSGSQVLNHEPFITSGGRPNAYIPRSGRGLSDHLPLLLFLNYLE